MAVLRDDWAFVHPPKTGGTSVSAMLGGMTRDKYPQHVPFRCFDEPGLRGFGFLRNPWHLMVSLYYFLWQSPLRHRKRVDPDAIRAMGFKRWLLEGETFMSNEPIDGTISTIHTGWQYVEASYPGMDKLAHPVWGLPPMQRRPVMWYLEGCEFIGQVETMGEDLNSFARALGIWKGDREMQRQNRTVHKPHDWRAEYDSETIEHVAKYFAPDIEVGGYAWT